MKEPAAIATCLCGDVHIEVTTKPKQLTQCNCSVCRRYGTLWAYYTRKTIAIDAPGGLDAFVKRVRGLRFMRCANCGCITNWEMQSKAATSRVGVNARLMDPSVIADIPIKILDGDKTWKTLGHYVRPEIFLSPYRVKTAKARARSR